MTNEEARLTLQENFGLLSFEYPGRITEALKIALKALSDPPLPSNLKEAARSFSDNLDNIRGSIGEQTRNAFKAGAKWKKEHLWKDAQGDDLPIFDREVIVLYQPYPCEGNEYAVGFAHRPNPDGWDGKNLLTDEIEYYTPETYDKGGWNIPDVKFWLDCDLPKMEE